MARDRSHTFTMAADTPAKVFADANVKTATVPDGEIWYVDKAVWPRDGFDRFQDVNIGVTAQPSSTRRRVLEEDFSREQALPAVTPVDNSSFGNLSVGFDGALVITDGQSVYKIDVDSNTVLSETTLSFTPQFLVSDSGQLLIMDEDSDAIVSLNSDLTEKWSQTFTQQINVREASDTHIALDRIYVTTGNREFLAVDRSDGSVVFEKAPYDTIDLSGFEGETRLQGLTPGAGQDVIFHLYDSGNQRSGFAIYDKDGALVNSGRRNDHFGVGDDGVRSPCTFYDGSKDVLYAVVPARNRSTSIRAVNYPSLNTIWSIGGGFGSMYTVTYTGRFWLLCSGGRFLVVDTELREIERELNLGSGPEGGFLDEQAIAAGEDTVYAYDGNTLVAFDIQQDGTTTRRLNTGGDRFAVLSDGSVANITRNEKFDRLQFRRFVLFDQDVEQRSVSRQNRENENDGTIRLGDYAYGGDTVYIAVDFPDQEFDISLLARRVD